MIDPPTHRSHPDAQPAFQTPQRPSGEVGEVTRTCRVLVGAWPVNDPDKRLWCRLPEGPL